MKETLLRTEMNQTLSEKADRLRNEIKDLLPSAQEHDGSRTQDIFYWKDQNGNTLYGGPLLDSAGSGLIAAMELGKVGFEYQIGIFGRLLMNIQGWGWNLAIFAETRPIRNDLHKIYLVPLSDDATIMPGGRMKEGCFTFIEANPSLSPGAPVIFIALA